MVGELMCLVQTSSSPLHSLGSPIPVSLPIADLLRKSPNKGKVPKNPVLHPWWLLQLLPLKLTAAKVPS